ncbi:hypothetical protein ES703_108968 [subsurface metagenome]
MSGQRTSEALVFFPWKGLNVVREYVVPTNPKTDAQNTQRDYVRDAVAAIHTQQGLLYSPLDAADVIAVSLWASKVKAATTWFNQLVKNWIDQKVAGLETAIFRDGYVNVGAETALFGIHCDEIGTEAITQVTAYWGTSPTALVNTIVMTLAVPQDRASIDIAPLTGKVKYYFQARVTAPEAYVGVRSGIYHGTPTVA